MCHKLIRPDFNRWPNSDIEVGPFNYHMLRRGDSETSVHRVLSSFTCCDCCDQPGERPGVLKTQFGSLSGPERIHPGPGRGFCSSGALLPKSSHRDQCACGALETGTPQLGIASEFLQSESHASKALQAAHGALPLGPHHRSE